MTFASFKGKCVVVTGATGLVGSQLCRTLLLEGAEVVAIIRDADAHSALFRSGDSARVRVVSGAVDDGTTVERALTHFAPSALFHLAAQTQVQVALANPLETFEANVRGTYITLEAARRHGRSLDAIVIASSDKAYGTAATLPYLEETPLRGEFPYDASKACADLIARSYAVSYGLPVVIARCANIFGGGDLNWDRLVPGTIRSLMRGARPVLRSNGALVRDWIHVGDVVAAYLLLAKSAGRDDVKGEAFNFSYDDPRNVLAVVDSIRRAVGVSLEPIIENVARAEIEQQRLSSAKARRMLAWAPMTSFDDAMVETVAWYRAYLRDSAAVGTAA